jgi:hypothetical protein
MKLMFRISNLRTHPKCVLVLDLIHFFSIKITSKINNVFVWCTKSNNHFAYVLYCATLKLAFPKACESNCQFCLSFILTLPL